MRLLLAIATSASVLASLASAQSFNIDTGALGTTPDSSYGAASGISGHWNDAGFQPTALPLTTINGAPTCVTITATTVGGIPAGGSAPLIGASFPNDAALYNDFALVPGPAGVTTWTIAGLEPAVYDVYVYSLSPLAGSNSTLMTCLNFTAGSGKYVCGTWTGSGAAALGTAYVVETAVTLTASACTTGVLTFDSGIFGGNPFGAVNGIQIIQRGGGTPAVYCQSGTSGFGCIPVISLSGSFNPPSASIYSSGFVINASNLDGQKQGVFFYSVSGPKALPWCGAAGSLLCVRGPLTRTVTQNTGGAAGVCNGNISIDWNNWISTRTGEMGEPWSAGDHVWVQCWYRDPSTPCSTVTSNLTEGLHFVLEP
ncbi:MAG: hypothetical protein NTV21_13025 [Planctomycetota bacterium]|nr:hypothetical protein [Planctomycetota bacterium]